MRLGETAVRVVVYLSTLENIKQGCLGLQWTNALAYLLGLSVRKTKSYIALVTVVNPLKLFFFFTVVKGK